jgi:uncharacterized protein
MALLVKKFRTRNGLYLYDTWTNEILQVDRAVFHLLPDSHPEIPATEPPEETEIEQARLAITSAKSNGYFSDDLPSVCSFPETLTADTVGRLQSKGPDHLILNITERCNLRCRYCSFSGAYLDNRAHSNRVMSREVLSAALDWYFAFAGRDEYSLGFYGGEPLGDFPLLRDAVDEAKQKAPGTLKFRLTTNATLLSEQACRFLIENDFRVNISIDGPQPVHDRYRVLPDGRGSFDKAWEGLRRLYQMDPGYFARGVSFNVVAAAPMKLVEVADFVEQHPEIFHDHLISVSSVNPYPSCLSENLVSMQKDPTFPVQKEALLERFRERLLTGPDFPEDFPFAFFKSDFMDVHQRVMMPMKSTTASNGQCVPGDAKCFVNVDGQLYMCERVGDSRPIGNVWKGFDSDAVVAILREYDAAFKERCARCWAIRFCSKCYVTVRHGDVFSEKRIDDFCRVNLNRWQWVLEKYCEIRESNPDAFSWCAQIG